MPTDPRPSTCAFTTTARLIWRMADGPPVRRARRRSSSYAASRRPPWSDWTMPMRMIQVGVIAAVMLATAPASGQQIGAAEAFTQLTGLVGTWDVTERDNPKTKEV